MTIIDLRDNYFGVINSRRDGRVDCWIEAHYYYCDPELMTKVKTFATEKAANRFFNKWAASNIAPYL